MPDIWLTNGNPWEIARSDITYKIGFYGTVDNFKWSPAETACSHNLWFIWTARQSLGYTLSWLLCRRNLCMIRERSTAGFKAPLGPCRVERIAKGRKESRVLSVCHTMGGP